MPECYPLKEVTRAGYPAQTEKNVRESDGTLVLKAGKVSGGTRATVDLAKKHGKPWFVVQLEGEPRVEDVLRWIGRNDIRVLNVAGPRESKSPGILTLS